MMTRIISFSLWGSQPKYCEGVIANARLAESIYPGWTVRVYHDAWVPHAVIDELKFLGAETVLMQFTGGWNGLFWRFLPACDREIDALIVRDTDSRLNPREKAAVDEWIATGHKFHGMRDHYEHTTVPIMGGMWGCRGRIDGFDEQLCLTLGKTAEKGDDQKFLGEHIWPLVRTDAVVHDRFHQGMLMRIATGEIISPEQATLIKYMPWPFGPPRNDHMPPDEVLLNGERLPRSVLYEYHPSRFGEHDARAFPPHEPMDHSFHVGMIVP